MTAEQRYELYRAYCRKLGIRPAVFVVWRKVNNWIPDNMGVGDLASYRAGKTKEFSR